MKTSQSLQSEMAMRRLQFYESRGWSMIHNNIVEVKAGPHRIDVDLSATADEHLDRAVLEAVYNAAYKHGLEAKSNQIKEVLGISTSNMDI